MQQVQLNYVAPAPKLIPHARPYPGMTPIESAQKSLSLSEEFADVIAATFFSSGAVVLTTAELMQLTPRTGARF